MVMRVNFESKSGQIVEADESDLEKKTFFKTRQGSSPCSLFGKESTIRGRLGHRLFDESCTLPPLFPALRLRGCGRLHSRRQPDTAGRIFRKLGLPAPHSYRQGCTYRAGGARPQARRMAPRERVSGMVSATRGLLSIYSIF